MPNIYNTARGSKIDIDRLKLMNETTIAVGNANMNARGDIVERGKIVKTREQVAQENYNLSGNNIVKEVKRKQNEIEADIPVATADLENDLNDAAPSPMPLDSSPRGGLANAVSKNEEIQRAMDLPNRKI